MIETWAALRREAVALLIEGLLDLGPVFEADAKQLGQRIDVLANDTATRLMLRRPEWIAGVGIGLEWTRTVFDRHAYVWLYAGLQHDAGQLSEESQRRLVELAAAAQPTLGSAWTSGQGAWPLWRWIRPDGEPLDEQALFAQARRGGLEMLGGHFAGARRARGCRDSTGITAVAARVRVTFRKVTGGGV